MRFFNTEGPVVAERHYCIPPLERLDLAAVLDLIRQKRYFVIHAPRQTGKTSALLALRGLLNSGAEGDYSCVYANMEAAQAVREDVECAMRWATAKELSALAGIVVAAVGVLLGGTQWAVSSALETPLTFAMSPLREDLRLVQADMRSVQADMRSVQADIRSLSEGQAEIRGQLAVQGAEVSALREEVRSVRVDVQALSEGQTELRERLVRVETLLESGGSSSDGDQRAGRPGASGPGGTESHPG